MTATGAFFAFAQGIAPDFNPPAPVISSSGQNRPTASQDTIVTQFPVRPLIPQTYDELMERELATDLDIPSNISTTAEFDPVLGFYVYAQN